MNNYEERLLTFVAFGGLENLIEAVEPTAIQSAYSNLL
jgi:hypothetical protein